MARVEKSIPDWASEHVSPQTFAKWLKYGLIVDKDNIDERIRKLVPGCFQNEAIGDPSVISFFSGCGGMDLGFMQAGFHIKYANDFDLNASNTYSRNIGPIDARSIYDVEASLPGRADVLLAGFPCQPFSNAGSRKGTSDPRGTLFWETLRFIEASRPKVVVFENVRGLLSMRNPDGGLLIDAIVDELERRGYKSTFKLLNAATYGVPQNRHRVVIIGVKSSGQKKTFDWNSMATSQPLDIRRALANLSKKLPNYHDCMELSPQAKSLIVHIPEGGSWKSVPRQYLPERLKRIQDNMERYHSPNFYRRFATSEVMGTVTATSSPENSGILHPTQDRRYTVREIARFQTFPDDFVFYGTSVGAMYRQIGNAVPPLLAKTIAKELDRQLF